MANRQLSPTPPGVQRIPLSSSSSVSESLKLSLGMAGHGASYETGFFRGATAPTVAAKMGNGENTPLLSEKIAAKKQGRHVTAAN